jgi:hypothetical protein
MRQSEGSVRLLSRRRRRVARRCRLPRLRTGVSVLLTAWMITRPVRLTSTRWWRSPNVAASVELSTAQGDSIERMYERSLVGRRRCVERLIEASNRVNQLIRDGVYDQDVLTQTQAIATAAAEERTLRRP